MVHVALADKAHLDAGELGRVDKWCVQKEELEGAVRLYCCEFNKHLGRFHCVPNTGIQDGQNPPRGRHLVGKTEK